MYYYIYNDLFLYQFINLGMCFPFILSVDEKNSVWSSSVLKQNFSHCYVFLLACNTAGNDKPVYPFV